MNGVEDAAERLVEALDNVTEGESVVAALVALGPMAIGPLRRFLLEGRPRTVYQPRRWAVRALGELNAREVLAEYLTSLPSVPDPAVHFSEEAVQNAAFREFLRWPGMQTTAFLLGLSINGTRAGLVEVFGKLRVAKAIPYLDRALEDDLCRPAAEQALTEIGEPARKALLLSASTRLPAPHAESPSSLRRRQSVLRVLAAIGIEPEDWRQLRSLLDESDSEIVTLASVLAVKTRAGGDRQTVIRRLLDIAGTAPWFLMDDIADCLLAWYETARGTIQVEVNRRMEEPEIERIEDQCLRLLLRVMRRAEREGVTR